jgi:hypothetical protein
MSIQPLWRVYPVIMTCHKCLHLGPKCYKISLFRTKVIQIQSLFKISCVEIKIVSFWTWALKQYCRVWKTLQLSFWAFLHSGFRLMENFALQASPCNFLKLLISPWEVLIPFLLCSSSFSALSLPWRLLSFLHGRRSQCSQPKLVHWQHLK